MNNTGNYVSLGKFFFELGNTGQATRKQLVLSNKVNISGTLFEFDFATSGDNPEVGDFLIQGDFHATISLVAGGKLRADDATNIVNGKAFAINTELTEKQATDHILDAMAFIDRHTRQWFNERTFDASNPISIEGNNSKTLFLSIPIIEITQIKKFNNSEPLDLTFVEIFDSREFPDDRRNPMIKLRKESDDVLFVSAGRWMRGVQIEIFGTFGFLEPDGSTPRLIERATLKLALRYASVSIGESASAGASQGDKGSIKKEKTDFHEIEFYNPNAGSALNAGTGLSGDDEIDDVIAAYKGPIIIEGTYPDIGVESPILSSVEGSRTRGTGRRGAF